VIVSVTYIRYVTVTKSHFFASNILHFNINTSTSIATQEESCPALILRDIKKLGNREVTGMYCIFLIIKCEGRKDEIFSNEIWT